MHFGALVEVEDEYISDKKSKCKVQPCSFETDKGYQVKVWFNDAVVTNLIEFVEAADGVKINMDNVENLPEIDMKSYIGKRVAFSVSHSKSDKGKPMANIDNFYSADKVPFDLPPAAAMKPAVENKASKDNSFENSFDDLANNA